MKLFHRTLGEGQPLVILHGLFGSSDNWLTIGKLLSKSYKVYLVDQRNHGQSPKDDKFSYEIMARDLEEFISQENIKNPIIIGHSMGGKVAMEYAVNNPHSFNQLIVVDIAPREYPVHHQTILEGLNSIDLSSLNSRSEANKQLSSYVPELGVRQFLLKNLSRNQSGFSWKVNLPIITNNIEIIGAGLSKSFESDKEILFIRGLNSGYIKDSDFPGIYQNFPGAVIETVENAGHWVHAEQPEEFLRIVNSFLDRHER